MDNTRSETILRKPDWLKIKVPKGKQYVEVKDIIKNHKLHMSFFVSVSDV